MLLLGASTAGIAGTANPVGHARTGYAIAAVVAVFALVAVHLITQISAQRRDAETRELVARYCAAIEKRSGTRWRVTRWAQESDIAANGDTSAKIDFTLAVEADHVDFVSFTDRVNWDWPARHRSRVRVRVEAVDANERSHVRSTVVWLSATTMKVLVHLDEPLARGSVCRVRATVDWPAKCAPLMKAARADELLASFGSDVEEIAQRVTLPAGFHVRVEPVGVGQGMGEYSAVTGLDASGRTSVRLVARAVPAYRKVGVRLDVV
ncbi:hypothetical protein AB0A74_10330 [Saccharothrix sp. NPDC042600]|uniref:hypothetical protein n=1 Tax=Saccharothrix TaxID=2071 RepID=UPI00340C5131|nr:hypothetical protein GCM10017745_43100 [Saccharothrix mutabilis subsp. capreolus]